MKKVIAVLCLLVFGLAILIDSLPTTMDAAAAYPPPRGGVKASAPTPTYSQRVLGPPTIAYSICLSGFQYVLYQCPIGQSCYDNAENYAGVFKYNFHGQNFDSPLFFIERQPWATYFQGYFYSSSWDPFYVSEAYVCQINNCATTKLYASNVPLPEQSCRYTVLPQIYKEFNAMR